MIQRAQDDEFVMSLLESALARPREEREAHVRSACGADSELFSVVWRYVEAEQRMRGFLVEPLVQRRSAEPTFSPGDLLDGRFRIIREVAQGGMGIVYEALDEKLERRIALKHAKAGFGGRLPPEVRNASEISHPNVCKIFEIHTAATERGDVDFFTMEFLEGPTLSERLRDNPPSQEEARKIARQLCAGLAEAHSNHVIHGDLKSNNVILTTAADGTPRAVITDFGLAQTIQTPQRTAQSGRFAGTPDYMAPELLEGGKASVGSDLYALGVILHELITGERPKFTTDRQGRRKLLPVHHRWDWILRRCLAQDPLRRFHDADKLSRALTPLHLRRWFLGTVAASLLATASGIVTYERATAPKETARLAMLPIRGAPATLNDAVSARLAELRSSSRTKVSVIPLKLSRGVDTVERARAELDATHVLHGAATRGRDDLTIHILLTDARSNVSLREWKATYVAGETKYAPVALAGIVTGTLRLPLLTNSAVVNEAAMKDYSQGLTQLRTNAEIDAALLSFQRAVTADPDSPLTHAGLAEARWYKYFTTRDRTYLDLSAQSVRQAELRNPDAAEVHSIAGVLQANQGWYEQAAGEYLRAIEIEPGANEPYRRLAYAYEASGLADKALTYYLRAIELEPNSYRNHRSLGSYYYNRSKLAEALNHFRKAVDLGGDDLEAHFALGTTYSSLGQFAEAEKEMRLVISRGGTPMAFYSLGVILMRQSKDRDAIPYIAQALERFPERQLWWMNLGTAYRRSGLPSDALQAYQRGLAAAEKELARDGRSGRTRAQLAYLCARLGNTHRAESELAQALQMSATDADTRWMAAATHEALGQRDTALSVLSGSPPGVILDLSRWPDLAGLHQDSRFRQLVASQPPQ